MPHSADRHDVDLIVLGSGVGGLTAAATGAAEGLRVLVVEHADVVGGTSARSSGTVWVPNNHYLRSAGIKDDRERAEAYLAGLVGDLGDPAMWRSFLDAAPQMLASLERTSGLRFRPYMRAPDYRQDCPGAASGGRCLEPMPYDGRLLGEDFARLAWPLPELMVFGGMMVTRGEAQTLLRADRSLRALALAMRMAVRFAVDRLGHRRGTRLVLGNALVARLMAALRARNVPVWTGTTVRALSVSNGVVQGVEAVVDGRVIEVHARCGVLLAGGGFPANAEMRARYLPKPTPAYTPAAPGCDGSTIRLALAIGAALGPSGSDNALWFPSSIARRKDGSTAVYPHIVLDRAKPGLIAVDHAGWRFVNEAISYHEFVRAMYRDGREADAIPTWLVCDSAFIARYGIGLIRPRTPMVDRYVRSGYLRSAATIAGLAVEIGVPADVLTATVERFNAFADSGVDEDFARGGTIYERSNGDPDVPGNPCLGRIGRPPYYALAVWPTPLGTSLGLRADADARVCRADGSTIAGLYVCGNDMHSAFGGEYPGAGAQLGLAMTFAWLAARHAAAAGRSAANPTRKVSRGEENAFT